MDCPEVSKASCVSPHKHLALVVAHPTTVLLYQVAGELADYAVQLVVPRYGQLTVLAFLHQRARRSDLRGHIHRVGEGGHDGLDCRHPAHVRIINPGQIIFLRSQLSAAVKGGRVAL